MSNGVENCTAKEFIRLCFADDRNDFWENLKKRKEENFVGIYNRKETCILPDLDSCCKSLYIYHQYLWEKQSANFSIPMVSIGDDKVHLEIIVNGKTLNLGSDSLINIYWHWKDMQDIIIKIKNDKEQYKNALKEIQEMDSFIKQKRKFPNESDWKNFIWLYLQKSNTIGGFIVFPRHNLPTINSQRGEYRGKIKDRFDLTLECIKRFYNGKDSPLHDVLKQDEDFFNLFGKKEEGFKNYAKFFCLDKSYNEKQNWVKKGEVLNIFDNEPLNDNYNFNEEPLPTEENWWTFYRNIMDRLDARNQQIKEIIEGK